MVAMTVALLIYTYPQIVLYIPFRLWQGIRP